MVTGNWTVEEGPAPVLSEAVRDCFPKTADRPAVRLERSREKAADGHQPLNVGIVLSGGQAPGEAPVLLYAVLGPEGQDTLASGRSLVLGCPVLLACAPVSKGVGSPVLYCQALAAG